MRSLAPSACLSFCLWHAISLAGSPPKFDWSAVTPSTKLTYYPCYDSYECARLTVPRNWLDVKNNKTVEIAVIRLPATVPADDPTFGGSIITNPGGPGGSGVSFLQRQGNLLRKITQGKKHYEIVSFDPRGVENTTPRADCFGSSSLLARDAFLMERKGAGGMGASESGLKRSLALAGGLSALCESVDSDEDILSHVSTASVARDILEIADRIEEHRTAGGGMTHEDGDQAPLQLGLKKTPSRVLYWGFSYGTVLGNTLASMYPGRMGRVILDGVVDIDDFMGDHWLRNLMDAEKTVQYFYDSCFEAGDSCPLGKAEDTSGEDIKARVEKLVADVSASPVSFIPADRTSGVRVITDFDIRDAFRLPVYAPLWGAFQQLATALAEALKGNHSRIPEPYLDAPLQDACGVAGHSPGDAQMAILCGDFRFYDPVDQPSGTNYSYWQDYAEKLKQQSPSLGPWWAGISPECAEWRLTPKMGFKGPWTTPPADPRLDKAAPAAPILFTSTRLDPVTPLANAYRMSNAHPGSAVLVRDNVGHCAISGGWGECFAAAIRAYLDDGVLPENGTVCNDVTCKPFGGGDCQVADDLQQASAVDLDRFALSGWAGQPLGVPF
ncbi:unnamed protein product [Discula destructiva]